MSWIVACAAASAHAQTVPDAGSLSQPLLREQRARETPSAGKSATEAPAALPPMPSISGLNIEVRRFAFAGNTLFRSAQLEPLVATYLNRPLDFQDLLAATKAVAEFYRQAGWVVQTYLPAQDLNEGEVTIQVLETTLGELRFEEALPSSQLQDRIRGIFAAQLIPGQALNARRLDRATLLSSDLPGVSAEATLLPGAAPQTTDVLVKLTSRPAASLDLGSDNGGSVSTGVYRINATGRLGNLSDLGDRLQGNWVHSEGSDYAKLAYTLPVGTDGWRIGINGSGFDYKLTATDVAALKSAGSTGMIGLEASYPLLRSLARNLQFTLNADQKTFDNRANGAVATHYQASSLSLGLSGTHYAAASDNAFSTASLQWVSGDLNLDGSPNQNSDALTTRAAGLYNKLRYSLSHQREIASELVLYGALSGQASDKNLDSSEKLYLGGMDGVRAFPASEAGGSEGRLLNLELRWRLRPAWELSTFYDWGEIQVNRNNDFTGATTHNRYALQGAGLALSWQTPTGSNLRLSWARRLQANPNATATGADQDGTLRIDRVWASVNLYF
jgi:hemolysin activation/secretion protein